MNLAGVDTMFTSHSLKQMSICQNSTLIIGSLPHHNNKWPDVMLGHLNIFETEAIC